MARTVDTTSTFENWRQNYNDLATDVGGLGSLTTGDKSSIVYDGVDDALQLAHTTTLNTGTGDFTINFTNNPSDANYVVAIHSSRAEGSINDCLSYPSICSKTTSSFTVHIGQTNPVFSTELHASPLAEICDIIVFAN